jgi:hypothetical protein
MQDREERDHQTMWKRRKAIIQQTRDRYIAISSEIDAIIHGQLPFGSKTSLSEQSEDDNGGQREGK